MTWIDGVGYELPDEVRMARQTARDVADAEIRPVAAALDKEHRFPGEIVSKLAGLGLMGCVVPERYGGSGLSTIAYALVVEEISAGCASTGIILSAHQSLCVSPLLAYGSDEQKERWLPPLARGEWLGCFALSEPGSGSDAAALTCRAERRGDRYIVRGTKNWITNAPESRVVILFATTDPAAGHKGVTAFVHRTDLPGVGVGKREEKLGIRASPTSSLTYDDVEIPASDVLGGEGKGFGVAMTTLNGGRIGVAAQAVGIARESLADALSYASERKAFGKTIVKHQSVQNYLADAITGIDSARYLTLGAASLKDRGLPYAREAAMAKLHASKVAVETADRCVQIHGGYGYVTDYPAERHLRDAKITEIYEGTSEIQRLVIATHLEKEAVG